MQRKHQHGLTLIELMVSVTIGLLLLSVILAVVVNTSRNYEELNRVGRQVENGRFAMDLLGDEIHHAGYFGRHYELGSAPAGLPDPCSVAVANLQTALALPLQGYNDPSVSPIAACLPIANHIADTDILVVRRASTTSTALGSLEANAIYLQSNGGDLVLAQEDGDTTNDATTFVLTEKNGTTPIPPRRLLVHIYHLSPCNEPNGTTCDASADDGDPVPTLKRLELTATPSGVSMTSVALATGIENLQFEYGVDSDGDGAPNGSYTDAPADTTAWANVVSVRAYLLARTLEESAGHTDSKVYNLGLAGSFGPFGDGYKRRVFTSTARVVNTSARRE